VSSSFAGKDGAVLMGSVTDNLGLAFGLAALAICIRPTTLVLWAFLGVDLVVRRSAQKGITSGLRVVLAAVTSG
jgi:phosphatidylinositol glycan class B